MKGILASSFFFISSFVFSQATLSGKVVSEEGKPIELIEVLLLNNDSIAQKSELTDEKGIFKITTKEGNYIMQLQQLGTIIKRQNITLFNNLDLGTITVNGAPQQLKEVVIEGKKKLIERKVDRLVFNVENSISATSGDALDALKVTPGLRVQNDQIAMIGKSGMAVMVDDRLIQLSGNDLINFLKTISSDNIKSIEVITTPPAKYDAEGNSGIVNIKLKKAKPNSWSSLFRSSYKQSYYPTGSSGNGFNYQKNKTTISTNINYSKGANFTQETQEINYTNQNWNSNDGLKNYTNFISGRIAVDYKINNKLLLGLQYLGGNSKPNIHQKNLAILSDTYNHNTNQTIETNLFNNKNNINHSINIHGIYDIDTIGRKVYLDVDYFNYQRKNNQVYSTNDFNLAGNANTYTSVNNTGKQNIENYAVKIDVEHPLKWLNLDYGGKLSFTNTISNIYYFDLSSGNPIFDPNRSNKFEYEENNQALYFNSIKKFANNKLEIQFGLRLENTQNYGLFINNKSAK